MSFFASNLRFLRKQKGLTQEQLADKLAINRAMIGSYEESRAEPKYELLQRMAYLFKVSIHDMIDSDMEKQFAQKNRTNNSSHKGLYKDIEGRGLRVLPIVVDRENRELITVVPSKAAAGYLNGYADPEFIETLPTFNLPFDRFKTDRTYRTFQISGDSMLPIESGSYIICEYVMNWHDIRDGYPYIIVTANDGIVFKRLYNRIHDSGTFLLKSDNLEYEPYELNPNDILEIWYAVGYIRFDIQQPDDMNVYSLTRMMMLMQNELNQMKKKVN
jgi:transcriptional regulator with XRE-family HTH domain